MFKVASELNPVEGGTDYKVLTVVFVTANCLFKIGACYYRAKQMVSL